MKNLNDYKVNEYTEGTLNMLNILFGNITILFIVLIAYQIAILGRTLTTEEEIIAQIIAIQLLQIILVLMAYFSCYCFFRCIKAFLLNINKIHNVIENK